MLPETATAPLKAAGPGVYHRSAFGERVSDGDNHDNITSMRTALFLVAGFLFLGASALVGKLFANHFPGASRIAIFACVAVWLVVAAVNMWVGIAKAGYSTTEELPVFLLIFGLPAAAAVWLKWQWL